MLNLSKNKISRAINAYQIQQHKRYDQLFSSDKLTKIRQAAVIIPMIEYQNHWHVLLTQRSQELVEHRGQVAYPGGARERRDENLQATALREMYEEVGVNPGDVDVLVI